MTEHQLQDGGYYTVLHNVTFSLFIPPYGAGVHQTQTEASPSCTKPDDARTYSAMYDNGMVFYEKLLCIFYFGSSVYSNTGCAEVSTDDFRVATRLLGYEDAVRNYVMRDRNIIIDYIITKAWCVALKKLKSHAYSVNSGNFLSRLFLVILP